MARKQKIHPEYLTVRECQEICRYKGPEPIRRAVYRRDLPAVRIAGNRMLIPYREFQKWFRRKKLQETKPPEIDSFEPIYLEPDFKL